MIGILAACNDLDSRIHHILQMETAGLHRILELMRAFDHTPLDELLNIFQQTINQDKSLEIQRHVDEMDKADPPTFHPSPMSNVNCSVLKIPVCQTAIDKSYSMNSAKHAADTA